MTIFRLMAQTGPRSVGQTRDGLGPGPSGAGWPICAVEWPLRGRGSRAVLHESLEALSGDIGQCTGDMGPAQWTDFTRADSAATKSHDLLMILYAFRSA